MKNASYLCGLDTYATEKELWSELGEVMTACIGPAGENLVRFACIVHGLYMHERKKLRGGFFGRTGGVPTRYYEGGSFEAYEKIGPETFNKLYVKRGLHVSLAQ
ncbi:MAG: hypothetical protein NXY59_08135 [Aigarchaeota archaeon]|nr:hypothetical protein [Candidatus Pelearchaeum maunauluense]